MKIKCSDQPTYGSQMKEQESNIQFVFIYEMCFEAICFTHVPSIVLVQLFHEFRVEMNLVSL